MVKPSSLNPESNGLASPTQSAGPLVAILLCTYNGEAYLRDQIESFLAQTHTHWRLFVSDDGSTDGTLSILDSYQNLLGERLVILRGPSKGFAQNFLSLIRHEQVNADAYAFSDQDDIWLPEKLERSLVEAYSLSAPSPFLYCSRTQLIDTYGEITGLTPLFSKRPSFRNALVQSLAGANTMVINESTRQLMARTDQDAAIVAHDWLAYMIVAGCGGSIVYDPIPTLLYRQHADNLIGANTGLRSRMIRIRKMLGGRFKQWNEINLSLMSGYSSDLTAENRWVLEQFNQLRSASLWRRLAALKSAGFYRQTLAGTVSLYAAVILNQV